MTDDAGHRVSPFIITKEYRRFAEFCDACQRYRYIGLCYGPPGVGKTLSARHYAHWNEIEPVLQQVVPHEPLPFDAHEYRTVLYTPSVANTPRQVAQDVHILRTNVSELIEVSLALYEGREKYRWAFDLIELIIVDEVDRLKMPSLEQLRDIYDRSKLGLILIGMPGLEKRLARYPQLYSRVGFIHQFRHLSIEEVQFIVEQYWKDLGLSFAATDFTDAEALATIVRVTSGNFRLLQRLFLQIERILEINQLRTVTKEVVEAARENLVIGVL